MRARSTRGPPGGSAARRAHTRAPLRRSARTRSCQLAQQDAYRRDPDSEHRECERGKCPVAEDRGLAEAEALIERPEKLPPRLPPRAAVEHGDPAGLQLAVYVHRGSTGELLARDHDHLLATDAQAERAGDARTMRIAQPDREDALPRPGRAQACRGRAASRIL